MGWWAHRRVGRSAATVRPVDLVRRIRAGDGDFLLFALTPPRSSTPPERIREIAEVTAARLGPLGLVA